MMSPTIANILNFAGPDMIEILLFVLLLLGAKKLPELARGMGQTAKEFGAAALRRSGNSASPAPMPSDQPELIYEKSETPSAG
jgi:sec-independent protein translocase protein TatA